MTYSNFKEIPIPKNIDLDDPPYCIECDIPMRLVIPKKEDPWKHFWGCHNYPKCECSYSINSEGDWYDPLEYYEYIDIYDWCF